MTLVPEASSNARTSEVFGHRLQIKQNDFESNQAGLAAN
jgi:hypothetical protein